MQPARDEVVQSLICPVLGRYGRRSPRREDVVSRVSPLAARIAPVVEVLCGADDRKDDRPLAAGRRVAGPVQSEGPRRSHQAKRHE